VIAHINGGTMDTSFKAIVVDERDGQVTASLQTLQRAALPEGDVLVAVAYSSFNYKDGLALTGRNKVVRTYPMIPGIDLVGTVEESQSPAYKPGDHVILTGWGVGERHWGGFAQLARVKSEWLVPLPEGLSPRHAIAIGTAGFTAMLALTALEERGLAPDEREVLVTGASGGVGSMAVALLAKLGYTVVASSGRAEAHAYLTALGAHEVIDRAALTAPGGALGSARWGGAIDTVGGETLAGVLRTLTHGASVAACGNAGGLELRTTIAPFILRGVSLLGIDSLPVPLERRREAWARLARELPAETIERIIACVAPLADLPALAQDILAGRIRGRVVVDVNA
jgi:acrylyl-CoA reductase (NADPH)